MPYIIAIVLVVIGGVLYTTFQKNVTPIADTTETTIEEVLPNQELVAEPLVEEASELASSTEPAEGTTAPVVDNSYVDGTYTTRATYLTPRRDEYSLDVTITVANDIVVDASVNYGQGAEKDPNAARFEGAYRTQVIGKSLDEISLSRVGGASLTTGGFNQALAAIKADARP